jgi:hypothetical protein
MTRPSRRELERRLEELEADTHADTAEYDRDPLTPEETRALAELFDVDPWDTNDTDAGDALAAIHRRTGTDR